MKVHYPVNQKIPDSQRTSDNLGAMATQRLNPKVQLQPDNMSVVIHLGGQPPSTQLAQRVCNSAGLIIAADSGFDQCRHNGVLPHVLTGDFDSISGLPVDPRINIIPAKEQTSTDFEKALRLVPADADRIDILGGTGLRSDHFLTNLLIATEQPAHRAVIFHDDLQTIHRVTPDCSFDATLAEGTVISLIPFASCSGTSTKGLLWNLDDEEMGPRKQFGQSNRVTDPDVAIRIGEGCLYVVVNRSS